MADFKWQIDEASEVEISVEDAEEIKLDDVKVVLVKGWAVREPDGTVAITVVQGGTVENVGSAEKADVAAKETQGIGSLNLGRTFNQTVILIMVVLLGIGFLATLFNGIWLGTVDFTGYMMVVFSLLTGLGIGGFRHINDGK
jgi:hypothetical protein